MSKKVLQFFPKELDARRGGAYSYLFNLRAEGTVSDPIEIVFLSDLVDFKEEQSEKKRTSFLKKILKPFLPPRWIYDRRIINYLKQIRQVDKRIARVNLDEFDILHFHEAADLWNYEQLLEGYHGKILFTSHSPVPYHLELLEEVFRLTKNDISRDVYQKLEMIDRKAFDLAAEFVLPCKESFEGYWQHWPAIKNFLSGKKIHYLPTGVPQASFKRHKDEIFRIYNIPPGSFVICFTGRHSPVKGYDLAENSARILLEKYPDMIFLVAGKRNGSEKLKHERWIDVGWTDDPFSIINASHLHLTPNRETFFDLNSLESMSLGKPILLTETGGNKFFKQFNSPAVLFSKPVQEDIILAIENCYHQKEQLSERATINKAIYEQNFTSSLFQQRYADLYKNILA